jgi:hypothetical protein
LRPLSKQRGANLWHLTKRAYVESNTSPFCI